MVLAVVLVFGTLAATVWALCFHRTAFRAVHRPVAAEILPVAPTGHSRRSSRAEAGVGRDPGPARGGVGQLEATRPPLSSEPVSVLGWDGFLVLSVLSLDGTVLLACRQLEGPGASSRAGFAGADQTMVLRLGDDHRADAALAVFEDWRQRRTRLRLRPIEIAGAIEILDARQTRIRAPLISA